MEDSWKVYIIYNKNYSYVGATNNITKRLKKHNQELPGGAKYTRMVGKGWEYICYISGFLCKTDALKFEWALKHTAPRKLRGIYGRMYKLEKLLEKEYWTQKAPSSINYKLKIMWCKPEFILEDFQVPGWVEMDIADGV